MRINFTYSILIILYSSIFLMSCENEVKFNSEKWKNTGDENITLNTRFNMMDDLIDSKILINKNESEVTQLIGKADKLNRKNNFKYKYYPVKEKYGWDIDPEELIYLEVQYNQNGLSNLVKMYNTK